MGAGEKQKKPRPRTRKNRYCAGAKLSEHKFLRILRGFSEGLTIAELKPTTHVSGKTIRATYRALRERLQQAITIESNRFGGAGRVIAMDDSDGVLDAIRRSRLYRRHRKLHAPRMKGEEDERLLAMELLVRLLCSLDLRQIEFGSGLIEGLKEAILGLRPRDPIQRLAELIPGARPHAHPESRLYEEYRRHLLKQPLRSQWI